MDKLVLALPPLLECSPSPFQQGCRTSLVTSSASSQCSQNDSSSASSSGLGTELKGGQIWQITMAEDDSHAVLGQKLLAVECTVSGGHCYGEATNFFLTTAWGISFSHYHTVTTKQRRSLDSQSGQQGQIFGTEFPSYHRKWSPYFLILHFNCHAIFGFCDPGLFHQDDCYVSWS